MSRSNNADRLGVIRLGVRTVAVVAVTLCVSVLPARAGSPVFHDATFEAGVSFTQTVLPDTPGNPMHAGGAVGDFNGDGWPDLFVIGGGLAADKLFINQGNGTFTDQAGTWFAPAKNQPLLYRGVGANVGDYNNDGCLDLFVTSMGDLPGPPQAGKHRLYRNSCDGTFSNMAVEAHVNQTAAYPDGYGVTFGDYDLDGNLDLWVGGWHLDTGNDMGAGRALGTKLFHNNGDETFTDVTTASGVRDDSVRGFGAIFADTNGDRYPELLVAGDFGTSRYYINNRHGTFTLQSPLAPGSTIAWNGMGTTLADFDRDGLMDWYIGAIFPASQDKGPPGNRLYMNMGNNQFSELPASAGVNDGGWCWGAASPDIDNDGWPDLVQTNGWFECDPVTFECFADEPTYVWRNNGDNTFTDIHAAANLIHLGEGRGLLTLDYDRDGDMDVVNLTNQGDLKLFRNDLIQAGQPAPTDANWLEVVLDTSGYPDLPPNGFGTHLKLRGPVGRAQYLQINGGSNYLSNSEQVAHFGMGSVSAGDLTVTWPTGFRVVMNGVPANQRLTIFAEPPYSHAPLVRGQPVDLVVSGLIPGEVATFGYSLTGTGAGPCDPNLGGMCVDLLPPIEKLGTAVADASGTATLTIPIGPKGTPGTTVYSQVTVRRGGQGKSSLKSNVIVDQIP